VLSCKLTILFQLIKIRSREENWPIKSPFAVKKSENLFFDLNKMPQPITSPWPYHSGLIVPFGHSKGYSCPQRKCL
jgi:hypothetical protein